MEGIMKNRTRWTRIVGSLLLAAATLASDVRAQAAPPVVPLDQGPSGVRIGLGLGVAAIANASSGIAARGGLTVPFRGANLMTLRVAYAEEFLLFTSPSMSVWDVGVLYGRQARGKWTYGSAAAGLALTGGMQRGARVTSYSECYFLECLGQLFAGTDYEERPFTTVGIPFELEAGFTFSSVIGIALNVFGNVNQKQSTLGASLSLLLGDLR
jgi:hypothetical protein